MEKAVNEELKGACCCLCDKWRAIPRKHGDYTYGYCIAHDEWFLGSDKVSETECDEFGWRKW